ncbi:MAG: hypothetical protein A2Y93_13215 [Chloroflexi bacterium RBG_13_68_17]|nr:MAG: hypothetical protein A2Y93_13215 [Chloroflexi bacterium RBG_13_68_17]
MREETGPRKPRGVIRRIAFVASGLVPLLSFCGGAPDVMLIIYTAFVAAWLFRPRLQDLAGRLAWPLAPTLLALTLASGLLTESLAWLGSYLAQDPEPALLHPQLLVDLILSPGIYAGWALAWLAAFRLYRYSLADVFVVQGIYGVFIEQQGAVFLQGLRSLPVGLLLWVYVFLVYGSAMGLAYLPVAHPMASPERRRGWARLPLALAAGLLGTILSSLVWMALLHVLGVTIPARRPIWEAPLL